MPSQAVREVTLPKATEIIRSPHNLRTLFTMNFDANGTGTVDDGVSISSFGRGQVSGVTYTVPAHGEISFDVKFKMQCVTPDDVATLDKLVRSMLDASHYEHYDELSKFSASGGVSFFGFFGFGASASYEDTKHTMSGYGLSEENQRKIVDAMANIAQNTSLIEMTGTIYNRDYPYSVSGDMFAIVMDADIKQSNGTAQHRTFLAPNGLLVSPTGESLPAINKEAKIQPA